MFFPTPNCYMKRRKASQETYRLRSGEALWDKIHPMGTKHCGKVLGLRYSTSARELASEYIKLHLSLVNRQIPNNHAEIKNGQNKKRQQRHPPHTPQPRDSLSSRWKCKQGKVHEYSLQWRVHSRYKMYLLWGLREILLKCEIIFIKRLQISSLWLEHTPNTNAGDWPMYNLPRVNWLTVNGKSLSSGKRRMKRMTQAFGRRQLNKEKKEISLRLQVRKGVGRLKLTRFANSYYISFANSSSERARALNSWPGSSGPQAYCKSLR